MKEKHWTKIEKDILRKLENYRNLLDDMFGDGIDSNFNFDELFIYLDDISELNIDEKIINYTQYLKGVAIGFYDNEIQKKDLDDLIKQEDSNLNNILHDVDNHLSIDWISLEKNHSLDEITDLCSKYITGKSLEYINKSKHKSSLMIGLYHYHYLKKIYDFQEK